ncbi:MAG: hypothetical protein EON58_19710, partial [Alphaproteobacteria bacterium]
MPGIFVERIIAAQVDRVWSLTQDPKLHERWDLRFTKIEYLPRDRPEEPQRFRYETRIGFGLAIAGEGETVGERNAENGSRTSALKFWSDSPVSLIRQGSGYWQYEPADEATIFRTRYDYEVRWGGAGRALDRLFRPIMGWATAWSFDALRLWAEREVPPELSRLRAVVHGISRLTLAIVWLYHGLVPKLLFPEKGERELTRMAGVPSDFVPSFILGLGLVECAFGLAMLLMWHRRWLLTGQIPVLLLIPLS